MCFFVSLIPATFWVLIGYFVLFSSAKVVGGIGVRARLSDLDFCDRGRHSDRRCLCYAGRSLSDRVYVPENAFS
jgi:hypothetical protein